MTTDPLAPEDLTAPKHLEVVPIEPPPVEQRIARDARFAAEGEKKDRYSLPSSLDSASPVGYRTRPSITAAQAAQALKLLALRRPTGFAAPRSLRERELFDECSLGVLLSRQSTNYRGLKQVTLGPSDSGAAQQLLAKLVGLEAPALSNASHTHVVLSRTYRTPFTLLLTFVGHKPLTSLATVAKRVWEKRYRGASDLPTIGYLPSIHLGILADGMERAAVIASQGRRRAQVFMAPFCGKAVKGNRELIARLESLVGLSSKDKAQGWQIALVAQVGEAHAADRVSMPPELWRKLGALLVSLRSERIQPGVNAEEKAPAQYLTRQDMHVPEELTTMAGRAAYNAFAHWTACPRERAKQLLLLDRVDVLTPNGKQRLRAMRAMLSEITDRVVEKLPLWADLPTGKALSRNANRGRKAFSLAGQRIYIAGLSEPELREAGIDWEVAIRGLGAAACRSALYVELMGCVDIPEGCDLLAGICLMAGPVNQNDIGKQYYGYPDLLAETFADRAPASLLVWTLKAKTVADPIGNEEQLLNARRKGALVDLRPGPHEVVKVKTKAGYSPLRKDRASGSINHERAFAELGNFVRDREGLEIPGNQGSAWPEAWRNQILWPETSEA